jgi:hypothetical protein
MESQPISVTMAKAVSAPRKVTKKKPLCRTKWEATLNSSRTTGATTTTEKGGALENI